MMIRNRHAKCFLAVCTALAIGLSAHTAAADWSAAAVGCTPDRHTVQNNQYDDTGGQVRFQPGETGFIKLTCDVTQEVQPESILLTYKDFPLSPELYEVRASLQQVNRITGEVSTVAMASSQGDIDEEGFIPDTVSDGDNISEPVTAVLDFQRHYYFVELSIWRAVTELNPTAVGVMLREAQVEDGGVIIGEEVEPDLPGSEDPRVKYP